ncbi:DNA phosphorothioation-dependent restriction protein DptG [Flavobacterium sp. FlaQc-30]|uniref:DNA phosphorothioation-dependent restriction protein DptG n=1 Tax=Flavobacterium sp. FlaQc-30 TaxID=3374179 RepID=UPI0037584102
MKIELKKSGSNGLDSIYLTKNKEFRGHYTGNQIKLLPFKTNPSGDNFTDDFKSFQGVIGELFRIFNSKHQISADKTDGSFKVGLKESILKNAIEMVETENVAEFKNMLSKLFFDEESGLVKFNIKTLSYMNFINSDNAIKEVSKFIFDVFLSDDFNHADLLEATDGENLLHQLILQSLPELPDSVNKSKVSSYCNLFPELKDLFLRDFDFLKTNNTYLLKHIEDFFKYYYFQYLSQLVINFNSYGNGLKKIKPIYFTMDWETLSESRLSNHTIGWKQLKNYSPFIFAHVNTLEFLNYIHIDDKPLGSYNDIVTVYDALNNEEKERFDDCLNELVLFYRTNISLKTGSWEECEKHLSLSTATKIFDSPVSKEIYRLWYTINYQFMNTDRKNADVKYGKWFYQLGSLNYTKNRGRMGNTTVLSQELLLFLTRVCIGTEEKITLKTLWDKFRDRGILFDEMTKLEITKLFEKINLIEKKSDSGDAQYVKSTI